MYFPKKFTVRGSQCFTEWSPWCWMVWSGSRPACLPLPFICLPVLFICLPGWVLVVGFPAGLSPISFHLFPSSSFVSQAGCLWSGCRLACLPLPFICLPLLFTCLPVLFICLPRFWSGWMVWSDSRPACLPLPFICLPVLPDLIKLHHRRPQTVCVFHLSQVWEEEETNKRKWETSQPGTRPEAPSLGDK